MSEWIKVKDRLPKCEEEVLIIAASKNGYKIITTAIYEDGNMAEDNSCWCWCDIVCNYDEENDTNYIPEGWWEYRHFNGDNVYNNSVDYVVTHWQPLPEPPQADAENKLKGGKI